MFLQFLFLPAGEVLFSGRQCEGDDVEDGGLDVCGVLGEEMAVHDVTQLHQEARLGGQLFPGPLVVQQRGQSGQAGREMGEREISGPGTAQSLQADPQQEVEPGPVDLLGVGRAGGVGRAETNVGTPSHVQLDLLHHVLHHSARYRQPGTAPV